MPVGNPNLNKVSTRFSDKEFIALIQCAYDCGLVDRNGKPKVSTFIRHALKSNQVYKKKLILLNNKLGEPRNV